jgi:TolA-binding protein
MRFTSSISFATLLGVALLAPVSAPAAASKEMQELQRDVADLQDQIKKLQTALDAKIDKLQNLIQQQYDLGSRTSTSLTANMSAAAAMQSDLKGVKEQVANMSALSTKVENASNDIADLRVAVTGLVTTINKQQTALNDILNQVRLIQSPQAAPPETVGGGPGPVVPPPSGQALFNDAVKDQNGGKPEIALKEYTEFLRLYPDDGNAPQAQSYIAEIYYNTGKLDLSAKAYDAVIEQYSPDPAYTPNAYFMKGMALKKGNRLTEAKASFQAVIAKFPRSDEAKQARTQLTSMGSIPAQAPAPAKKGRKP